MPNNDDPNPDEHMKKKGYMFGKLLGEGSYARVKITECPNKQTAACKMICKKKAPKDFVNKFLPRELEIIRKLDHENVLKTHEVHEYTTKVYVIMEMADNGDLLDYIKKNGARPDNEAKRLFGDVLKGIDYLHGIDVVHRDLKCENLLLFKNNRVKIADFGFARSCVDADGRRILSETYCGSAAYAAPEILKGTKYQPKAYDMWSTGVILFIIACGSMPFDDGDIRKMLKTQEKNDVHFPSRVEKSLNDDCKKLIRSLLECNVTKRLTVDGARNHSWLK